MSASARLYDSQSVRPSVPDEGRGRKPLYRIAAVAALISAVFIPIQIMVFLVWPPPLEGGAPGSKVLPFRGLGGSVGAASRFVAGERFGLLDGSPVG